MRINKLKIVFWLAVVVAFLIVASSVAGVYQTFWSVPEKKTEIAELTRERDVWESRAKELDRYVAEQDKIYRVATKFDNFFMMIADPDQVINMECLEEYIKDRKEFYEIDCGVK